MRRQSLIVALVLVSFLSILATRPALAAGVWVSPSGGDYNTEFTATADGFDPFEPVDTWVGRPYQWRVGQGTVIADADGEISFSFSPDVTWGTGSFVAIAKGLRSGREYQGGFTIGGGGNPLTPCGCKGVLLGNPGGLAVNYNAEGYAPNETVIVYMQDPAAQVRRLPNAQADPWGNLVFVLAFSPDSLYGPYLITVRGLTTGNFTYNTLTFWGGIFDHRSSNPISTATPTYILQGGGFTPQETVSIRLTYPNGPVQTLAKITTPDGGVGYTFMMTRGSPLGIYTLSAVGLKSGHVVSARFGWDGVITPIQ